MLERRVECKDWSSEDIQARVGKYLLHFMFDMTHPLRVKQCQICARADSDLEYQYSKDIWPESSCFFYSLFAMVGLLVVEKRWQ